MLTIYKQVEVEIQIDDFEDHELLAECEHRGLITEADKEKVLSLDEARRRELLYEATKHMTYQQCVEMLALYMRTTKNPYCTRQIALSLPAYAIINP